MELGKHSQNTNKIISRYSLLHFVFRKETLCQVTVFFQQKGTDTELSWIFTIFINVHIKYTIPKPLQE